MVASSRAFSKKLMKVLTTPSKIANSLDWRKSTGGTVCVLDIHSNRIGVTVSQHPSMEENSSMNDKYNDIATTTAATSYSIPITTSKGGRGKIADSSRKHLSDIVKEHNVCGFVVSWPLQQDTGLMGASCGRTLFVIEELLSPSPTKIQKEQQKSQRHRPTIFTHNRPLCLWDGVGNIHPKPDVFGRSPVYARTSNKKEHRASKEQYHQDESIVAVNVWKSFVQTNWPEIFCPQERKQASRLPSFLSEQGSTTTTRMPFGNLNNHHKESVEKVNLLPCLKEKPKKMMMMAA